MPAGSNTVSGESIASVAESYQGKPYKWGGYLPSGWDCSGFVNYILGNNFGLTLPGGAKYTGKSHGPVAASYLTWAAATTISKNNIVAGDLCVWQTHIGIAISPTQMVSALDPQYGTKVSPFSWGPAGEVMVARRINGATLAGANAGSTGALAGCGTTLVALPVLLPLGLYRRYRATTTARRIARV